MRVWRGRRGIGVVGRAGVRGRTIRSSRAWQNRALVADSTSCPRRVRSREHRDAISRIPSPRVPRLIWSLTREYQFWYSTIDLRHYPAYFFCSKSGREPVLEWLRSLPKEERAAIGLDLQRLEYRWPIGMPHSRALGGGLHELRSKLPRGRAARLLFFVAERRLIVVTGFMKKTRTTPHDEIALARVRKRAWEDGNG